MLENEGVQGFSFKSTLKRGTGIFDVNPFEGIINIDSLGATNGSRVIASSRLSNNSGKRKSRTSKVEEPVICDSENNSKKMLCVEQQDQGVIISQEFKVRPSKEHGGGSELLYR